MSTSPRRLGKYELQQRLGQGSMAEVWKALDTQLQRYVAIKLLHANLQVDPNFITRFQREAQLIASLHHPNIVKIHDFQVTPVAETGDPIAYMVMDYVEGQTLADYIRNTSASGRFPSAVDIVHLFASISQAIDYAHQKGMLHRDIKPANILLDRRNTMSNPMGEPILTDFGVAKLLGMSTSALSGTAVGTPLYISPEQARGLPGNERSDLYSLGIILYEIVTGVTPFRGDTPMAVIMQQANAVPPSPSLVNPQVPAALAAVVLRSIAKDPGTRFPSASAMVADLAEALNVPAYAVNTTGGQMPYSSYAPTQLRATAQTPAIGGLEGPTYISNPRTPAATPGQPSTVAAPGGQAQAGQSAGSGAFVQSPAAASFAPGPPSPPQQPRRGRWLYGSIAALLIIALLATGGYFLFLRNNPGTAASPVVGHAFFASSGQLNPGSAQGIADELDIDLHNIPDPQPGKSYYAWLLGDKHPSVEANPLEPPLQTPPPILLARLSVSNGSIHFLYKGDTQHDNLFSVTSRFLITEENTNTTPRSPSTNHSTWSYYAEIPQTPYGANHLSALDHIRHLFYKETRVDVLGLPGGLDIWLFRDTEKLLEWAVSARDAWQSNPTDRSKYISILDYIDGSPNVHVDLPPNTPVVADPIASRVGLLSVSPNQGENLAQNPPGYVVHMALHLNGVVNAPDATPEMRQIATQIIHALNNATVWLKQVRKDAQQLFNMTDAQLAQPPALALLDDLVTQATYAYIGRLDPNTNTVQPAILQVHYSVQQLANFTISSNVPNSL
jgi:eukaryotic-like serine/threonine-protein kinase